MSTVVLRFRGNVARIKLALIPVLGVILLVVLFRPRDAVSLSSPPAMLASPEEIASRLASATKDAAPRRSAWRDFGLDEILSFNPFSPLPDDADAATQVAVAGQPTEVTADSRPAAKRVPLPSIDAIYESFGQRVAVVDAHIIRVGDPLADGRVVEITENEIVIAPKE